jgi:ATP phosphoribosyltransferase
MSTLTDFSGNYDFLNNFYLSPIVFFNVSWPSAEHLYQALKTSDPQIQDQIRHAPTPALAKKAGRMLLPSPDWEQEKFSAMLTAIRCKFQQHVELAQRLLATDDCELIESNDWHDNVWGDCHCEACSSIAGTNFLGKILMQVRSELQQGTQRLRLLVPSPSSRFYPQTNAYLHLQSLDINLSDRQLFYAGQDADIYYMRGFDIPAAIANGLGDLGITGLDAVYESSAAVSVVANLGIRYSEIVLASRTLNNLSELKPFDTIVTEYDTLAKKFFHHHSIHKLNLMKVSGAAEAYGFLPNVAAIMTLRTSGKTLIDNQLKIIASVFKTEACLIGSPLSLVTKKAAMHLLANKIAATHVSAGVTQYA